MGDGYPRPTTTRSSAGPRNMQYKDENTWLADAAADGDGWKDPSISETGHKPISECGKTTIGLWCMSPALSFFDAFNKTRSIVLATLLPMARTDLNDKKRAWCSNKTKNSIKQCFIVFIFGFERRFGDGRHCHYLNDKKRTDLRTFPSGLSRL
ncbi:uncharacterized protein CELE_Y54G2A.50 [Caenorhabditis elegans]|uniref:Uncharacterized protein n=1 Tax=Caenorhabditis elegans TaxID=6239 RepID=Q4R159_CAEEL|nr:Uncharacterized protein CELE_Y54G2A.50 [Caenorhabditis elegans]CCD83535.1 Uncharacterized protein CELE_Y54G2A.50 [Caenorhabditis elegans]|eukprot:NP_001033450.1 Uncharacterized protein CELE_Y54G2A.50 [Caenorhabditis elegans]